MVEDRKKILIDEYREFILSELKKRDDIPANVQVLIAKMVVKAFEDGLEAE